jgi:hypothetical protein
LRHRVDSLGLEATMTKARGLPSVLVKLIESAALAVVN